nr:hypothetical protein GCM10020185_74330 [Pseudomonas brassicacearum subsp. brassicacearum]
MRGDHFTEFKDEKSVIAAFNTPGILQDLLIRRLPEHQQSTFRHLFAATLGQRSEITLASNPIQTNLLDTLFDDNAALLSDMLTAQTNENRQFDWGTVLHLLSSGIKLVGGTVVGQTDFLSKRFGKATRTSRLQPKPCSNMTGEQACTTLSLAPRRWCRWA